jgi:tetratricopeptide (TPR) repeat protein
LPAAGSGFTGREAEAAALDALLEPGPARSRSPLIALIAGTAGVGKTTLAVHWAHRVAGRFPDGQLYIDLRGYDASGEAVRPATAVREFLDALRVPPHQIPAGPAAQAGFYRGLLAERRMLLLLDNARDADQVAPLLPAAPGCLVVVTSRDHLAGLVMTYGAHPLTLGLLPPDEAGRLLGRRVGHDRLDAEPAAAAEIVHRCAGLPLALAMVAARAAIRPEHPLTALAGELRDTLGALEGAADIRAVFSWSYDTLGDDAARLFRLVGGLHPRDAAIAAAASLAGVPPAAVRAPLAELTRANLLTEHAPGRYSCHDLLHAYAAELCQVHDTDRENALRRLVGHYVQSAYAAAGHLHGDIETAAPDSPPPGVHVTDFAGADEALAWFTAERPALLTALSLAADLRADREVCRLAQALFLVLHRQGRWHDRAETQRTALAAARRLGEPAEEARAHRNLAAALADLGHLDEAHRNLDIALALSQNDTIGQAWTHYYRDLAYGIQGREADALHAAAQAHALFEQAGDLAGQALALTNLGWYHGRLGNHREAVDLCERALVLHQKSGNRPHEAHTWSCLGDTHLQLGDPTGAVHRYRRALDLFREVGDVYGEVSTLAHLGACHHLAHDDPAAHELWHRAHTRLEDLDPSSTDQIHAQLATISGTAADAFRRRR